jgi:hypothetical protein
VKQRKDFYKKSALTRHEMAEKGNKTNKPTNKQRKKKSASKAKHQ